MTDQNKPKITIDADGTIHVDNNEEPSAPAGAAINPDDAIHAGGKASKSQTTNKQSKASPKQTAKNNCTKSKVSSPKSTTNKEAGTQNDAPDAPQNQENSDDSEGCLGCFISLAVVAAAFYAQFGLGIPIIGVLGMLFGVWVLVVLIRAIF